MITVPKPAEVFPVGSAAELPDDLGESELREFLESVRVTDGSPEELRAYCRQDFWRFVFTHNLVRGLSGRCLELGANPYFTTMLLREFTDLELVLANYFGSSAEAERSREFEQTVTFRDRASGELQETTFPSWLFNIETDRFPFDDASFDIVLCCEILEHLVADPTAALREIKRVLRPHGVLVLTTPNSNRLENVIKMVAGINIHDQYSGHGAYGRHNREYTKRELNVLLTYLGFEVDYLESADVYPNAAGELMDWRPLVPLVRQRERDLGQCLFARAYNRSPAGAKRPKFLFRSYPEQELETVPGSGS